METLNESASLHTNPIDETWSVVGEVDERSKFFVIGLFCDGNEWRIEAVYSGCLKESKWRYQGLDPKSYIIFWCSDCPLCFTWVLVWRNYRERPRATM